MKRLILSIFAITVISFTLFATNVRGKIKCIEGTTNTEIVQPNIQVELFVKENNEWKSVSTAQTDKEGMFYFFKLDKNKKYALKVNEKYYPLTVEPKETQDLPSIIFCK